MNLNPIIGILLAFCLFASCGATTPGAMPHEMGMAQHESAAQAEDREAAEHAAQFNPDAGIAVERCHPGTAGGPRFGAAGPDVCWTSATNQTAEHLRMAEEHHKRAADHRAGSAALQQAEAGACVGILPADRDMSPFEHTEDIAGVAPLMVQGSSGKQAFLHNEGAIVTFRAVPGMTSEWLQRVVDCHLARNSALGHQIPEMPDCPLVPKGASAKVTSTGNGFAVAIRADDAVTAAEILTRAQHLGAKSPVQR
jgi:hypothetical protein